MSSDGVTNTFQHNLHSSHTASHYVSQVLLFYHCDTSDARVCCLSNSMAFNLTGVDPDQYFKVTVAVNSLLFTALVLPSLLLCLQCAVALIFAKEINSKIRLLLVNILVAEISKWISFTVYYLTWPLRLLYQDTLSCKVFFSSFSVACSQTFTASSLHAILVYTFIKYGEKKLKWCVVIPFEAVSWLVTLVLAALQYFNDTTITSNGFCGGSFEKSIAFKISFPFNVLLAVSSLGAQIICGVLIIVYIKRNTLKENTKTKKAVAKVLAYFVVSSILTLLNLTAPVFNLLIQKAATTANNTTAIIVVNYLIVLVFNIPSIATPIVTIILLKPVRVAIKAMIKTACMCCRTRSVQ